MKRHHIPFVPLFCLLIASILLLTLSQALASVEYTVKKGENPYTIAKKFKVGVNDILKENKVSPKNIKPGTKLVIPVKDTKHVAARKNNTAKKARNMTASVNKSNHPTKEKAIEKVSEQKQDRLYHTVRKGDTLASLSKKYSIPASEIKELNSLKSSKLKKGKKLLVKRIGPRTYIVKKGDNLQKIAKRFDMEADDIMEINEMASPDLTVGQKLFLEERVDQGSAAAYQELFARNIEEELKNVSQTPEFAEKDEPGKLVTFAKKLMNIPYRFGGNSILGIDCSAYVKKVYGLLGVELPRTAREQFKTGEAIDKEELSIGDLVFFRTYASFPSHVGIYLGNNLFIHASSKGKKVTIDSLETPYYTKRFIGGKRLLTEGEHEEDPEG